MADLFAEVAIIGTALDKGLHYSVPGCFAAKVRPGSRVSVELGKRKATGVVLRVGDSLPDLHATITIRQILDTIDELPAHPIFSNCASGYRAITFIPPARCSIL